MLSVPASFVPSVTCGPNVVSACSASGICDAADDENGVRSGVNGGFCMVWEDGKGKVGDKGEVGDEGKEEGKGISAGKDPGI